ITASYATGTVTGKTYTGGLAGYSSGSITASYARGAVTGTTDTGGLVGENDGRVTASYWDTATSGQSSGDGGAGKTTSELQTPTGYTGIYATWNVNVDGVTGADDPWAFGTASQYPVLRVDIDGDGTATWREFGAQRPNRAPVFTDGATATREVAENTAAGENIGAPVAATDADGDPLTYALGGTDTAAFELDTSSGQLRTKAALDYETKASYAVTVTVTDGKDAAGGADAAVDATISVTVTVTNADEAGTVTLNPSAPRAGAAVTAAVTDADGAVRDVTWQWAQAAAEDGSYTAISGATAATYTPVASDAGQWLRATASYADGEGAGKSAAATALVGAANAPPAFAGPTTTREVVENTAAGESIGAPVTATDADGDPLTYALGGTDTAAFELDTSSGQLRTKAALDYETKASYAVTVSVSDGKDAAGGADDAVDATVSVTIAVTDVLDSGTLPTNVVAGTSGLTSIGLSWDAVATASGYHVEYRVSGTESWTRDAATLTDAAHIVDDLTCGTSYDFQVIAYAGPSSDPTWSTTSATVTTQTTTCPGPVFSAATYSFTVSEDAAVGTAVGTVTATGASVTYAITAGNDAGAFAIGQSTGAITVAGALDYETTTSYTLTAQASDGSQGTTTATVTIDVTDVVDTPPPAPQNVKMTAADKTSLTLAWDAVPGTAEWEAIDGSVTTTSRSISDLACETAYDVRVRGYGDGTTYSEAWGVWAELLNVRTGLCNPPDAPGEFNVSLGDGAFALSWGSADGAAKYLVQYRIDGATDPAWTDIATTTETTATLSPTGGVPCGATFHFQVQAYGDGVTKIAAWGAASAASVATTSCSALGVPKLSGAVASASVLLAWDKIDGATKYQMRYREAGGAWPATATDIADAGRREQRKFRVKELTAKRTYEFQVRAHGNGTTHTAGWGAWSTALTATIDRPPAPTGLTVGTVTANSVALSWTAIPGAASYQVRYRKVGADAWTTAPDTTAAALTISGLQPGTRYVFKVRAKGDGARYLDERRGPWSSSKRTTTTG
ncbi:MAG: cadherin domain-containing protein, partial [Gammaproteobacteria bacterium]|nr:cadherin domain-containing protein [Gammaproteobacteria bacterium]